MKRTTILERLTGVIALCIFSFTVHGQLQVSTALTPEQIVQQVLLGQGVVASNITFNGQPGNVPVTTGNVGTFQNGQTTNLGLNEGVILSTGRVTEAAGPQTFFASSALGTGSDPDLYQLVNIGGTSQSVNDRAVLEFDFVPTGDTVNFRFIFASEEYPNFVCSNFNDAFGFFVSGPGLSGPFLNDAINLAVVPGTTTPITINTINSGTPSGSNPSCDLTNSEYYVNNSGGQTITYNGFTTPLLAWAPVQCGETYHMKFAIADGGDSNYDSAVFLEGGSFSSTPIVPEISDGPNFVPGQPGEPSTILRGCHPVEWNFTRTGTIDVPVSATVTITGSAQEGVDYLPGFPTTIDFVAGQLDYPLEMMFPLGPTGHDSLIITINSPSICTGIGIINVFTFYVDDPPELEAVSYDVNMQCGSQAELVPLITGGYEPYTIDWGPAGQGDTVHVSPLEFTPYTAMITDTCGVTTSAIFNVGHLELPPINMTVIGPTTIVEGCESSQLNVIRPWEMEGDLTITFSTQGAAQPGEDFVLPASVVIPDGNFNILVPFVPVIDNVDEGEEHLMVIATLLDACGRSVDTYVDITIIDAPPVFVTGGEYFFDCAFAGDTAALSVEAWGGFGNLTITWSGYEEEGETIYVPVTRPRQIEVTATDECGTFETAIVNVILACEFNVPNVFSPNGDNLNDYWEIEGIEYTTNSVKVYNRWGKMVFDRSNYQNNWNADDLPDGTYFYEIVVDGHEQPYKGYVTILRSGS